MTDHGSSSDKPPKPGSGDLTGPNEMPPADHGEAADSPFGNDSEMFATSAPEQIDSFEDLDSLPQAEALPEGDGNPFASDAPAPPEMQGDALPGENELPVVEAPAEIPDAMERLRQYGEQVIPAKVAGPATFPFSLMIQGELADEEKARLLDIISRENMGIREVDLEPQLALGRVLIPRISEYAGVMLVQALRSAKVKMRLGPSDSIFATDATRNGPDDTFEVADPKVSYTDARLPMPAQMIPIVTGPQLPGHPRLAIIDTLTASVSLKTTAVEAERSPEFQEALEALKDELKQKAYRRGATAIILFDIQLAPLVGPMRYRLIVSGTAVTTAIAAPGASKTPRRTGKEA